MHAKTIDATDLKIFFSRYGAHILLADGSRVYDIGENETAELQSWLATGVKSTAAESLLAALCGNRAPYIEMAPPNPPPVKAFSLNLAQLCNMRCGYCYADFGQFGGTARRMPNEIACLAVDRLLGAVSAGQSVTLGFMGGEPLLHRVLLREVTTYAEERARSDGKRVQFSITTNGTLFEPEDAAFFQQHQFHVSISLDGNAQDNDRFRILNSGTSSYASALRGLEVLRRYGWPRHVAARATITARSDRLLPILDHLVSLGFDSVGLAPVLVSPDPALAFSGCRLRTLLEQMVECGQKALNEMRQRRRYPFSNLETALRQIHCGTHRPYPCGAGAGYLSVSAEGKLFACHRLIDNETFEMGNLQDGPDQQARARHLGRNHVDTIEPCRVCWARYLCGGGCYHEVSHVGRPGCDYIRGWLEFCLQSYAEVSTDWPEYFVPSASGTGDLTEKDLASRSLF
jgi:uncharacterized protein